MDGVGAGVAAGLAARPWLLVLVSCLIAAIALSALRRGPGTDVDNDYAQHYEPVARNILAGRGLTDRHGQLDLRYPPGYPALLAGCFWMARESGMSESIVLETVDAAAMAVSALLVFLIAARLWGPAPALLAWAAWTTYPLALYLLRQPNSETPFTLAILAAFYALSGVVDRDDVPLWKFAAAGVLTGVAMLIRPAAIGLGFVLAILVTSSGSRRRAAGALAILLGGLIVVAPWEVWVFARTGSVVALATDAHMSMRDGLTFAVRSKGFRQGVQVPEDARSVMAEISAEYPTLSSVKAVVAAVGREIRRHPDGVAELAAIKAVRSWYASDSQRLELITAVMQGAYLFAIALATVRAWRLGGAPRRAAVAVWAIVAYFWAMTTVVLSIVRYMVPVMSLLFAVTPALVRGARPEATSSRLPAVQPT